MSYGAEKIVKPSDLVPDNEDPICIVVGAIAKGILRILWLSFSYLIFMPLNKWDTGGLQWRLVLNLVAWSEQSNQLRKLILPGFITLDWAIWGSMVEINLQFIFIWQTNFELK